MKVHRVNFDDTSQCKLFDKRVLNTKSTFIQQSTRWARSIIDVHNDVPAFHYVEDGDDFLGASMYLYDGEFGSILCSNVQAPTIGTFVQDIEDNSRKELLYERLLDHLISVAEEHDCVTMSISSNPFNDEDERIRSVFEPDCGIESFIQTITIDEYFDDEGNVTFEDYNRRTNLSRNIEDAYEEGFQARESTDIGELESWYEEIHSQRLSEVGGTPLPKEMFMNAFRTMQENVVFLVAELDGRVVGGDFCAYTENGILENMMLSSDSDYFERGVNFFIIDQLLRWCNKNDIAYYDWQSSNPPKGGVFRFKKQWGSDIRPYNHYTKILDEERFSELQAIDQDRLFSAYENHFIAPYHTLKRDEYTIRSKEYVSELS